MKKEIIICDDEMEQLGERLGNNEYVLDGKKYRLVRTEQIKRVSYYVEI